MWPECWSEILKAVHFFCSSSLVFYTMCYNFFVASIRRERPLLWSKGNKYHASLLQGDNCVFRHEPSALGCETVCTAWQQGKCLDKRCKLRHMELRVSNTFLFKYRQESSLVFLQIINYIKKYLISYLGLIITCFKVF